MNRGQVRSIVAILALVLLELPVVRADPPYVIPEWPWTTDQNGQLFNTISWNPTGADYYRVRCLLGDEGKGVAFPEPFYTRGGTNVLYVAQPDLVPWTDIQGTNYDFY